MQWSKINHRQEQLHEDTIHTTGNAAYPIVEDTHSRVDDSNGSNNHDATVAATIADTAAAAATNTEATIITNNTITDIIQSNIVISSITTFTSFASSSVLPPLPPVDDGDNDGNDVNDNVGVSPLIVPILQKS